MPSQDDLYLDLPLWGAYLIGKEAGIFETDENGDVVLDENGQPVVDVKKAHYLIGIGAIAAKSVKGRGRTKGRLVSTRRQIRNSLLIQTTET
jgi:hypothetical protein